MIISRVITISALNKLSPNQKSELVSSFSWIQLFSLIGIVVLAAAYFWLSSGGMSHTPQFILLLYGSISVIFIIGINYWGRSILRKKNFPESYINSYVLASAIRIIGVAFAFYAILNFT